MLASDFKTAEALNIHPSLHSALQEVMRGLEAGEYTHAGAEFALNEQALDQLLHEPRRWKKKPFNMMTWGGRSDCGTPGCIGGWCERLGAATPADIGPVKRRKSHPALAELFYPQSLHCMNISWHDVTPAQAAFAIRSYLRTGWPDWAEAVGGRP